MTCPSVMGSSKLRCGETIQKSLGWRDLTVAKTAAPMGAIMAGGGGGEGGRGTVTQGRRADGERKEVDQRS